MSGNLGPTVRDGKLRFLSVSQLEKFDPAVYGGCERRWWYRYVGRIKEAEQQQHKLGKQCHTQAEHYLKTGEDVLGILVRAGMRFLPRPGPDLLVEYGFSRLAWPGPLESHVESPLTAAGVPFLGSIDLLSPRGEWLDDEGVLHAEPGGVEVVDWKTSKQIDDEVDEYGRLRRRGYAKTAEQLAGTWQMIGYGEVARRAHDPSIVRLSHGYFQTHGKPTASKRSVALPAEEIARRWARADVLVERMKSVAGTPKVEDVPANYGACNAYKGCPHKAQCPRDPKIVLSEMMGPGVAARLTMMSSPRVAAPQGGSMSLIEKMKQKKLAEAAAAGKSAPASEPPAAVKAEMAALEAEERALRAGITPPDVPAPEVIAEPEPSLGVHMACGTALTRSNSRRMADDTLVHVGCTASKAPHVHARPAPTPTLAAAPIAGTCTRGGDQVELDIDAAVSKKYTCACGESLKVKPQKLPDGKYYAVVPKHGEAAAPTPVAAVEPPKEVVAPPKEVEKPVSVYYPPTAALGLIDPQQIHDAISATTGGVTLYLDAVEDGVACTRLEAHAEALCRELEREYGAADVRCAPEGSPLAFGRWKGALAALARANSPSPGAYVCSSSSELGLVVFEALASSAARVVRGVK